MSVLNLSANRYNSSADLADFGVAGEPKEGLGRTENAKYGEEKHPYNKAAWVENCGEKEDSLARKHIKPPTESVLVKNLSFGCS